MCYILFLISLTSAKTCTGLGRCWHHVTSTTRCIPVGMVVSFYQCVCVVKVTECRDLEKHNPSDSGHKFPSITGKPEQLVAWCSCSLEDGGSGHGRLEIRVLLSSTFTPYRDRFHLLLSITGRFLHLSIRHPAAYTHTHTYTLTHTETWEQQLGNNNRDLKNFA